MNHSVRQIAGQAALIVTAWTLTAHVAVAQEQSSAGFVMSAEQAGQVLAQKVLEETFTAGLTALHDELMLNARQERRWRAFLDASFARPPSESLNPTSGTAAPPLHRARTILLQYEIASRRQARAVAAMEALYRSLRPDQRTQLDRGLDTLASLRVSLASH